RARVAPGARCSDDQPARPRRPADARGAQIRHRRQWCADLRRDLGDGVLQEPRGAGGPDLQLLFTPASYAQGVFRQLEHEPGMTVAVCPVRPDSRGTIMAQSPDPFQYPAIRPNYLSAPSDLRVLIAGINHTRRIFAQPAMARYSLRETLPGPDLTTDEQFGEFARQAGTN